MLRWGADIWNCAWVPPVLQVQHLGLAGTSVAGYTGVNQAVGKIWREEGFAAFWKGNGVNIIRIFPYSAGQVIPAEGNSLSCDFNRYVAGDAAAGRNLGGVDERERDYRLEQTLIKSYLIQYIHILMAVDTFQIEHVYISI